MGEGYGFEEIVDVEEMTDEQLESLYGGASHKMMCTHGHRFYGVITIDGQHVYRCRCVDD